LFVKADRLPAETYRVRQILFADIRRSRVRYIVFAITTIVLTGCGSSDSTLTAAQLTTQGNSICRQAATEEKTIATSSMKLALPHIEQITTREIAELDKLVPPPSERVSYKTFLEVVSQITGLLPSLSSALAQNESAPANLLAQGRALTARAGPLAATLGLSECTAATTAG
jgi:uncharacterized protein YkwD